MSSAQSHGGSVPVAEAAGSAGMIKGIPAPSKETVSLVFRRILPILFLAYVMNFLDRSNISMVKADLATDVGIEAIAYGMGSGLFFITYCALMVPSNLLMHKIGARKMLGSIIFLWGLVSTLMFLVNGPAMFYVLRLCLGAVESGFYAGVLYFLTRWFPHAERARANSIFLMGAAIANILGNPVAGLLVQMHGLLGLNGWQWLFIMEGIPAVLIGIGILVTLPDRPTEAKWLEPAKAQNLEAYIAAQDDEGASDAGNYKWTDSFKDVQVLLTIVILFSVVMGVYANSYYLPAIIKERLGLESTLAVGLVTAIPYLVTAIVLGTVPQRVKPGRSTRITITGSIFSVAVGFLIGIAANPIIGIVGFCLAQAATQLVQPLMMANVSARFQGAMLAGTIALINTLVQTGGFFAPNILGIMESRTGSPSSGLWFVIGLCVITGVLSFWVKLPRTATQEAAAED